MTAQDDQFQRATALFDQFRELRNDHRDVELEPDDLEAQHSASLPTEDEDSPRLMPVEARRALVVLLRLGVVMVESKRLVFESLCRHEKLIGDHLNNMYLSMLLDQKAGLAILLQQEVVDQENEEEGSRLINKRTLTLYESLLLLVLRRYYQEREAAGEQKIVIDVDRIEALLTPFLSLTNSSRGDKRVLNGALTLMKEKRLISQVRGDEERFEITPVIRYVVNADFLERLLAEYQRLASDTSIKTDSEVQDA
jgi:hypothetical protein